MVDLFFMYIIFLVISSLLFFLILLMLSEVLLFEPRVLHFLFFPFELVLIVLYLQLPFTCLAFLLVM